MSKIDKLFQEYIHPEYFSYEAFKDAMKEYAEWYCEKFRHQLISETWIDGYDQIILDGKALLDAKLPEHE